MNKGKRVVISIALLLLAMAVSSSAAERLVLLENQTHTS